MINKKILIVDNIDKRVSLVKDTLSKSDMFLDAFFLKDPSMVETGYKVGKPIVTIIDTETPKINWEDAVIKIRNIDNKANIVLITPMSNNDICNKKELYGINSVIVRPFQPYDLLQSVESIIKDSYNHNYFGYDESKNLDSNIDSREKLKATQSIKKTTNQEPTEEVKIKNQIPFQDENFEIKEENSNKNIHEIEFEESEDAKTNNSFEAQDNMIEFEFNDSEILNSDNELESDIEKIVETGRERNNEVGDDKNVQDDTFQGENIYIPFNGLTDEDLEDEKDKNNNMSQPLNENVKVWTPPKKEKAKEEQIPYYEYIKNKKKKPIRQEVSSLLEAETNKYVVDNTKYSDCCDLDAKNDENQNEPEAIYQSNLYEQSNEDLVEEEIKQETLDAPNDLYLDMQEDSSFKEKVEIPFDFNDFDNVVDSSIESEDVISERSESNNDDEIEFLFDSTGDLDKEVFSENETPEIQEIQEVPEKSLSTGTLDDGFRITIKPPRYTIKTPVSNLRKRKNEQVFDDGPVLINVDEEDNEEKNINKDKGGINLVFDSLKEIKNIFKK